MVHPTSGTLVLKNESGYLDNNVLVLKLLPSNNIHELKRVEVSPATNQTSRDNHLSSSVLSSFAFIFQHDPF